MRKSLTNSNRANLMPLTASQRRGIVGGDPGMSLAVGGGGSSGGGYSGGGYSGGGYSGGDLALAAMGVGYAGGPMVSVTIGLPGDAPLSGFDNFLIGAAGTAVGGFTTAAVGLGLASTGVGALIAVPVAGLAGIAAGAAAAEGATRLLQYAANEERYAGRVRRLLP